jgi:RNA polymerase sigma-70 factor, ECF subfamily
MPVGSCAGETGFRPMTAFRQSAPPHSELLLAHAGGLRRLARALVHDAEEAEDALQETFAVALERAPERLDRPGAWLRQVLRSVVHKRLRGADRRKARELAVARAERSGDTLDLVARGELLQRVVDAVHALEPRLREVVLLRHFEGLPPREIARRTDTPLATVNGRLQRAHARLRSTLDEGAEGSWIPGFLLCFGWKRETQVLAGTLTAGLIAMTSSVLFKCSVAAAALATTAWLWPTSTSAVLQAPDDLRPPVVFSSLRPSTRVIDSGARRESVFGDSVVTPLPFLDEGPREYHLHVRAFGADDLPIEGAELYLAPPGAAANLVARTNHEGRATARWIGRLPSMEIDWALEHGTSGTHFARVKLAAGREYELAGSLIDGEAGERFDPGARHLNRYLRAEREDGGLLRFISNAAEFEEVMDHNEDEWEVSAAEPAAGGWTIAGRAFYENGAPAADVLVGCGPTLSRLTRQRTDADGWYTLSGHGDGRLVLFAGGGENGRADSTLEVRDDATFLWDAVLERGTELCGSVIFYDGAPAKDWIVSVDSAGHGEPFADRTRTDDEGRFCIPNCPSTKLHVRARPADALCVAPWVEQAGVLAASGHLPLLVTYAQPAKLDLPAATNSALVELRLVHLDSGAISWMRSRGRSAWWLDGLPPGEYRLESLAGSRGGMITAPFYVFPEEEVALYPWLVPLPCELELSGMPDGEYQRIRFELLDGPVRIDLPADAFDGPPPHWQLPPGDYRMHVAGHPEWTRELHLVEGQRTRIELPDDTAEPDAGTDATETSSD